MRSSGLDVGDKRIGIAMSDPLGILASPFTVLEHTDYDSDAEAILKIVKDNGVENIVVGLPQSLSGAIGAQAQKVQAFIEILKQKTSIPIIFRDERLSTVSAKRMVQESANKKSKKKVEYDAIAAAVILQGYLDEAAFQRYDAI